MPQPVINLKREAYDRRDDATGQFKNYDVLFPVVGEILSGGERAENFHQIKIIFFTNPYRV